MQIVLKSKNVFFYFSLAQNIAGNMPWKKKQNCFYISSGKKKNCFLYDMLLQTLSETGGVRFSPIIHTVDPDVPLKWPVPFSSLTKSGTPDIVVI